MLPKEPTQKHLKKCEIIEISKTNGMEAKKIVKSYIENGYVFFTFKKIVLDDKNVKNVSLPRWKEITKENYLNYVDEKQQGFAIITGKMSNITVMDFDVKNNECSYEQVINDYPELKDCLTVKTQSGGYHLYFEYDESIKTTTKASDKYAHIDIRNDDAIVYAPPTEVQKNNILVSQYKLLGGKKMKMPEKLKQELKQFKEVEKAPTKITKEKKTTTTTTTTTKKENPNNRLKKIENIVKEILKIDDKYFDSYEKWAMLGFVINNETDGSSEGEELFDEISKLSEKYDDKQTVRKQYYNAKKGTEKKVKISTLYSYLQELNPLHELLKSIAKSDNDASEIIYERLKDKFVSYKGRMFYFQYPIWISDIIMIDDIVLNEILNSNIYKISENTKEIEPYAQNLSSAKKIKEVLYSKIRLFNEKPDLYEKFHQTTKGKICFEDGYIDMLNKTFVLWEESTEKIYSTVMIKRKYADYYKNPNLKMIETVRKNIYEPQYGDKTEQALQFQSRALGGHHEDKRWASYLGNRNCGKGVEYELLKYAFTDYVSTFELGNMLYARKTAGMENVDCSKKLYWTIDLEFVRLAVSQEIPDTKSELTVNGKMLKKLSGGGDTIIARRNYDRTDTHFTLDTTFYIKGNHSLNLDSSDCNDTRLEFQSTTQFISETEIESLKKENTDELEMKRYYVSDPKIKDKCRTLDYMNAIIYLICENYQSQPITVQKNETDIDRNTLLDTLKEMFVFTLNDDDVIPCATVHEEDMLCEYDKGKIALELQSKNIFKKKMTKGNYRFKYCYCGIKFK